MYYFCEDMINITNLDPSEIKTDEKWNKDILIYDADYVTQIVWNLCIFLSMKEMGTLRKVMETTIWH